MKINKQLFTCEVQGEMLSSVKLELLSVNKQTQRVYIGFGTHVPELNITNTGSDVISHMTIKQSPTIWCQKVKIISPSFTYCYTLLPQCKYVLILKGQL